MKQKTIIILEVEFESDECTPTGVAEGLLSGFVEYPVYGVKVLEIKEPNENS